MMTDLLISADSHVVEPGDLWETRIDKTFRDRAPKVVPREDGGGLLFIPTGAAPFPVAAVFGMGRSGEALKSHMSKGYEMARPSGWDPAERLKDQDLDQIAAEVIYPSLAISLFRMPDPDLQFACVQAYNNWIAEFCRHDPSRLLGGGLIPLLDIDRGIAEATRCVKMGLQTVCVAVSPPDDRPYHTDEYDKFWAACEELGVPVSMHIGMNANSSGKARDNVFTNAMNPSAKAKSAISQPQNFATSPHEFQKTLSALVISGVLDRFPRLRLVTVESDVGWYPHLLYRLDHGYEKYHAIQATKLSMKPSEFVKRQVWATFQEDPIAPIAHSLYGHGNYMWGSDFPHTETTWPNSKAIIDRDFANTSATVKYDATFGNVQKLYNIDVSNKVVVAA
jgi:predicted TIM-barrel fold metal-dependent hydrolase